MPKINYICRVCKKIKTIFYRKDKNEICISCSNKKRLNKSVILKNFLTGEEDSANSITGFCDRHSYLGKNAKYHFSEVLNRKRIHYKGWGLAKPYREVDLNKVKKISLIYLSNAFK